jgi:hypothetical protein
MEVQVDARPTSAGSATASWPPTRRAEMTSDALQWPHVEKRATAEAAVNGLTAEPVSELVLRLNNWLTEASPGHLVRSSQADNGFGCPRSLCLREGRTHAAKRRTKKLSRLLAACGNARLTVPIWTRGPSVVHPLPGSSTGR